MVQAPPHWGPRPVGQSRSVSQICSEERLLGLEEGLFDTLSCLLYVLELAWCHMPTLRKQTTVGSPQVCRQAGLHCKTPSQKAYRYVSEELSRRFY